MKELQLVFIPKQQATFHSACWQHDYNPDLTIMSSYLSETMLHASCNVLPNFPNSQHRPIITYIGIEILVILPKLIICRNLARTDWVCYRKAVEKVVKALLESLDSARCQRWIKCVEGLDFMYSS